MATLLVVNNPKNWPLNIPGVEVLSARSYLTDPSYAELRGAKVVNLCRSYRYQSIGYYVSLLAEARGHKPVPSILTIQDMKSQTIIRVVSEDLDDLIQKNLAAVQSKKFTLSIYFGRNLAKKYDRLSLQLFNLFQVPMLRAQFSRQAGRWQLQNVSPVAVSDVPNSHRPFVVEVAKEHFSGRRTRTRKRRVPRYDLAILHNPSEEAPPSDERALNKFCKAAESLDFSVELITKNDYGRIAEFDGLFIRETTYVNHHTFRFARRAAAEGIVVIDDPESIIKCTNKVYLAELTERHGIQTPNTVIIHRDNFEMLMKDLALPCVLKQPDSSFSQGVVKVQNHDELRAELERMMEKSDLVIAQEYMPTPFDWRVGILNNEPLYVCKYHMARWHWQIIKRDRKGKLVDGKVEAMRLEEAPRKVVRTAVRAARLIGDGFYGVDLKQIGRKCYVMEINDNPSIEAGYEDGALKNELYLRVMQVFLDRIERRTEGA